MKKKTKAILISQFFWPESFPINTIIKNFKEIEFTIITAKPNYPHGSIFKNYKKFGLIKENFYSHKIYHIPILPRGSAGSFNLFMNYFSFIFSALFYGTIHLKKNKYDLIFVYNTSPITQILIGYYFKLLFRIKLVTWVQDIWPESVSATNHLSENFIFKIFRKFCHYLYSVNDLLILQSKHFFKYFKKNKINKISWQKKLILKSEWCLKAILIVNLSTMRKNPQKVKKQKINLN